MHPYLFSIGSFQLRAYGVMMALGILAGLVLSYFRAKQMKKYENIVIDFAFYAVLVALIGARIWEVAFSWDYYGSNLAEIPAVWHGGMSVQGAIIGGVLMGIIYTRHHKINFWEFVDLFAPGVVLGMAIGRIGCLLNGDAFGIPAQDAPGIFKSLGVVYQPGTPAYAVYQSTPLVPAEIIEGILDFIICVILLLFKRKPFMGFIFLLYASLYSLSRFGLEFLRADSLRTLFNLKTAQLSSILIVLVSLGLAFYLMRKEKRLRS